MRAVFNIPIPKVEHDHQELAYFASGGKQKRFSSLEKKGSNYL
jgi:hypothetical protein